MQRMNDSLWIRCNGVPVEQWTPFSVFSALRKIPFRPIKRAPTSAKHADPIDGCLLLFAAFKDMEYRLCINSECIQSLPAVSIPLVPQDVPADVHALWAVPEQPTDIPHIGIFYGDDASPDSEDEDVDLDIAPVQPASSACVQAASSSSAQLSFF